MTLESQVCTECHHPLRWHIKVTSLGQIAGPCHDTGCTCRGYRL